MRLQHPKLSSSFPKLARLISELKSKRQSFLVELMGPSSLSRFPFLPISPSSSCIPSYPKPSASLLQSFTDGVSATTHPRDLHAPAEPDSSPRFLPGKYLRHSLANLQGKQGAKSIMLAILVVGFLCTGKAGAVAITIAAYAILRLDLSSKAENKHDELDSNQQEQVRRQPHPHKNELHTSPVREDFRRAPSKLRTCSMPAQRSCPPPTNSVQCSTASDHIGTRRGSLRKLDRSLQGERQLSAPVSPSDLERMLSPGVVCSLHHDSNALEKNRPVLSCQHGQLKKGDNAFSGLKLGIIVLLALCGLIHGRVTAVLMPSCCILIFSNVRELILSSSR